jgi:hypothetical protein
MQVQCTNCTLYEKKIKQQKQDWTITGSRVSLPHTRILSVVIVIVVVVVIIMMTIIIIMCASPLCGNDTMWHHVCLTSIWHDTMWHHVCLTSIWHDTMWHHVCLTFVWHDSVAELVRAHVSVGVWRLRGTQQRHAQHAASARVAVLAVSQHAKPRPML